MALLSSDSARAHPTTLFSLQAGIPSLIYRYELICSRLEWNRADFNSTRALESGCAWEDSCHRSNFMKIGVETIGPRILRKSTGLRRREKHGENAARRGNLLARSVVDVKISESNQ